MDETTTISWDDQAVETFARHKLDVERGFETKDPNVNISSMDELLDA